MDLLTHEEYRALAGDLSLPDGAFIDGGYRPALSGRTLPVLDPASGDGIADAADASQMFTNWTGDGAQAVPEPSSAFVLLACVLALGVRRNA